MGKSTFAYSICNHFETEDQGHRLGASFFCSRQKVDLRSHQYIVPTIARQLADYSVAFADALSGIEFAMVHDIGKQIDNLLIQP